MVIKDRQYKKVRRTVTHMVADAVYGCDCCKKKIEPYKSGEVRDYLELTVFNHAPETESETKQFCSWKCVVKFLRTATCNYFISLPFLSFDQKGKGLTVKDFLKLLK